MCNIAWWYVTVQWNICLPFFHRHTHPSLLFFLFSVMCVEVYWFNLITIILDIIEKFSDNPDIDCIDLEKWTLLCFRNANCTKFQEYPKNYKNCSTRRTFALVSSVNIIFPRDVHFEKTITILRRTFYKTFLRNKIKVTRTIKEIIRNDSWMMHSIWIRDRTTGPDDDASKNMLGSGTCYARIVQKRRQSDVPGGWKTGSSCACTCLDTTACTKLSQKNEGKNIVAHILVTIYKRRLLRQIPRSSRLAPLSFSEPSESLCVHSFHTHSRSSSRNGSMILDSRNEQETKRKEFLSSNFVDKLLLISE